MWPYAALLFLAVGVWNLWIGFTPSHPEYMANLLAGALCTFVGVSIAVVMHADEDEDLEEIEEIV